MIHQPFNETNREHLLFIHLLFIHLPFIHLLFIHLLFIHLLFALLLVFVFSDFSSAGGIRRSYVTFFEYGF